MLMHIYEIEKVVPIDSGAAWVHQIVSLLLWWNFEGEQLLMRLLMIIMIKNLSMDAIYN